MDIFKLVGSVFVDTDEANNSLQKTDKKAFDVGNTLASVGKTAGAVGAAVVGATAAAVTGMVKLASNTASAADEIDKASIRMGVTAESYQEYAYAAGLAGVETSNLEAAARKLEGTGISFDDAIDSIMSLETAEERSAAAAELFGDKLAYQLSPMIEQTAEDFYGAKQEANDLGLIMGGSDVKAGAQLNDTLSKISQSFGAMANRIGSAVIPLVESFGETILDYMPTIQSVIDGLIPIIMGLFETLVPPLMQLVDTLLPFIIDLFNEIMPILSAILADVLPIIVELLETLLPPLMQVVEMALPALLTLLEALLPVLGPIIELLNPILQIVTAILNPLIKLVTAILQPLINLFVTLVGSALGPLTEALTGVEGNLGSFVEAFGNLFSSLPELIKKPINAIIGFINGLVSGVTTGINGLIGALNSLQIDVPGWVKDLTGIDSFGFNIPTMTAPQIPLLAKGGVLEEGSAIVGEDGPELIHMGGGRATVTPLNDNNNAFAELADKLDKIIELMGSMGVYINGSALVGQIAPEMDKKLGRMAYAAGRGM